MHDKSNSWLSKTCGRRGGKQVERGDQETGNQSRWWGGLRAYSSHNKRRKRESDNKKSERLGQIGAYSSPEKGIVIEGLVPMAIAPSMNVFVGICVCVCGWAVTGPWDHKERLAKAVVNHIDAMGLETAEILGYRLRCLFDDFLCLNPLPSIFHFYFVPRTCHYVSSLGIHRKYKFNELEEVKCLF